MVLAIGQNLSGFAPDSFCVDIQVYDSMCTAVTDPVARRRGSAGLDLPEQPQTDEL